MSITFYSLEAPQDVEERYDCQCSFDGEPNPDCPSCDGKGFEVFHSSSLSVQMSNANARDVMSAIGLPVDDPLVGSLETKEEISNVLQRIVRTLHSDKDDPAIPSKREGGETYVKTNNEGLPEIKQKTTMIYGGREAGYIQKRLSQLQKLCREAIKNGWTITWS